MPAGVWGARLVWVWVRLYTAALPATVAQARRAELLSDLHDQVADSTAEGRGGQSWALCRRMLRGVAADLVWRAQLEAELTGRDVILSRPAAVLTGLGLLSLPFSLMSDLTRQRGGWTQALFGPAWFVASAIWMVAISYGLVAAVEAVARRRSRR